MNEWDQLENLDPLLLAKVLVLPPGCWSWTGYRDGNGYGRVSRSKGGVTRQAMMAHRYAWELLHGPAAACLDHLCENRACIRPSHLEEVTQAENVRRGGNAQKQACPRGHPYDVVKADGSRRCRRCHAANERARAKRGR